MWAAVWCLLLVLLGALYSLLRYHYDYWLRLKVPYIEPSFFIGNLGGLLRMRKSPAEFIQDIYNHPKAAGNPLLGMFVFHKPAVLVRDPELLRNIFIKNFSKFSNRYSNSDYKGDPMGSQNIFFLKNPAWKEVRLKLTPFFSSAKMKQMFHLIEEVGRNLDDFLLGHAISDPKEKSFTFELKEVCALYSTDVIASIAYGVQANSFQNPNGDFRRNGREVFEFNLKRALEFTMVFFLPQLVPVFGFKVVPPEPARFLRSTIHYVMAERELSGVSRNDLIDILIELRNSSNANAQSPTGKSSFRFEDDVLVAQAALFFTAGFETSSATMSFALYELAKRLDLQQRLRLEIKQGLIESNGRVTQKMIDSLEYMHMVICEVLRLYPPIPFLDRECTSDSNCGYSFQPFHNLTIAAGTPIYIPVYGLHMDSRYHKNPELFDPERFSIENKKHLTPYTYLPFGAGPHACIGERLGMLQTKIGLAYFLRNHYVTVCDKTKLHMKLNRKSILVQAEDGIHLNVVRDPLINE